MGRCSGERGKSLTVVPKLVELSVCLDGSGMFCKLNDLIFCSYLLTRASLSLSKACNFFS